MLAPWGWLNGDAHLPPPHGVSTLNFQNSRPHIQYPFFFFFNIYETHYKVYTNKPRALLMQQALYNEPKRARLLWEDGMSVQTLGVFHFKNKLSAPFSPQPLDLHLPKSSLPHFKQAVHTGTLDHPWPATLVDSHNVSSALLVDKGIDLSDPAKDLGNSKTISPSTLKIKYTSADACPEIVGSS